MKSKTYIPFSKLLLLVSLLSSLLLIAVQGFSFSPVSVTKLSSFIGQSHPHSVNLKALPHSHDCDYTSDSNNNNLGMAKPIKNVNVNAATTTLALVSSLFLSSPTIAVAQEALDNSNVDDLEIAALPPVWVPIVFAIFILGGVGLLTSSLGDVYTEGVFFVCV